MACHLAPLVTTVVTTWHGEAVGIMDRWKRARKRPQTSADKNARPTPPSLTKPTAPRPPRLGIGGLARRLASQYPDEVPPEVLAQAAATEGLDPEAVRQRIESERAPGAPLVVRPRRVKIDELRVMDLSGLDSVRLRIKGSAHSVSDAERRRQGGPEYLLIREPDNEVDPTAVAVYGLRGRRVGYVSATRGAMLSPLLAQLDADAFKVSGEGATRRSIVLHVNVPKADALRSFVRRATH